MESIRQGADKNSKSFQANGRRQSHLQYNTVRKIIGEVIGRVRGIADSPRRVSDAPAGAKGATLLPGTANAVVDGHGAGEYTPDVAGAEENVPSGSQTPLGGSLRQPRIGEPMRLKDFMRQ
jgi:hypothetical protein